TLPQKTLSRAKKALHRDFPDFRYNVVSMGDRNNQGDVITFTWSPDFDTAKHPTIRKQVTVSSNGDTQLREYTKNPPIYHKKGLFVDDDYQGFQRERHLNPTQSQIERANQTSRPQKKAVVPQYVPMLAKKSDAILD